MGRKYTVFLDSGANNESCNKAVIDLEDYDLEDRWDSMSEQDREAAMKEIAFEQSEWGYYPTEAQ